MMPNTAVLAITLLCGFGTAQLPPQEESVGDNSNENEINNGPACQLCLDGSDPIGSDTPMENIFGVSNSLTCNQIITMTNLGLEKKDCEAMQLAAFQGGCCAESSFFDTPSSFDRCRLCPGPEGPGFLAFKEIPVVDGSALDETSAATCSDLRQNTDVIIDLLQGFVQTPGECEDSVLRRSAGWCGCMDASIECSLTCEGGAAVNMSAVHPLTGVTCQEVDYQVALLSEAECSNMSLYLQFDPTALCCPSSANNTTTSCAVCADGQVLTPSKTIDTQAFGTVSCADVQDAAGLAVSDQVCTDIRRQFAAECCLETPDDESVATCALECPTTGERPPDLLLQDPATGYSCNFLVAEYAKYTASQCANATSILAFDAVSFCCSENNQTQGEEQTESEEQTDGDNEASETAPSEPPAPEVITAYECRVCPKDKELLYPSRILFAYNEHTCSEIEATATSITTESACWDLLDSSRALSNCACRTMKTNEENNGSDGDEGSGENGGSNGDNGGSGVPPRLLGRGVALISLLLLF